MSLAQTRSMASRISDVLCAGKLSMTTIVTSAKRRQQHLLDIGQKDIAVHRTILNGRRAHSGEA